MGNINFYECVIYFFLFSVIGWICESIWCSIGTRKIVNRGFLKGPYCPIYGFGGLVISLTAEPLKGHIWLVYIIALISTSAIEYFSGWLLETLFHKKWWDYSMRKFNIKGRVCMRNSLLFGCMGIICVYIVNPLFEDFFAKLSGEQLLIMTSMIFGLLCFDFIHSLLEMAHLEEKTAKLSSLVKQIKSAGFNTDWFNDHDLSGSLERLRTQLENPRQTALAETIASLLEEPRKNLRLFKAFPGLKAKELSAEFDTLKENWDTLVKTHHDAVTQREHKVKALWSMIVNHLKQSYNTLTWKHLVWTFFIGCLIGYFMEISLNMLTTGTFASRQGMIYGPFNQVYGFGAVVLLLALKPLASLKEGWIFIISGLVGGFFEAFCSWFQETAFGYLSWEYSNQPLPFLGGRTSFRLMIAWGILGVVLIRVIFPKIEHLINTIQPRVRLFTAWAILIFMIGDMGISYAAVWRYSQRQKQIPATNLVEKFLDSTYPDKLIEGVYPNMKPADEWE